MKKLVSLLLAAMMVISCLAACSSSGSNEGNSQAPANNSAAVTDGEKGEGASYQGSSGNSYETTYKLGFCVNSKDNPVFVNWINYLTEHAPNYGFEFVYLSSDEDSAKELSNIEDLIGQGCDLIYLSAVNTDAAEAAVRRCNSEGIPVFCIDRILDVNECDVVLQACTDNYEAAKLAGYQAVEDLGEAGGKVAILRGTYGLQLEIERYEGFMSIVDQHSNIEVVTEVFADLNREMGYSATEDIIQAYPDVDIIYCENGEMAVGCCQALKANGYKPGDFTVYGYDGSTYELEYIKEGYLAGCVFHSFNPMNEEVLRYMRMYMDGEKRVPISLRYSASWCDAENLDDYWYVLEA